VCKNFINVKINGIPFYPIYGYFSRKACVDTGTFGILCKNTCERKEKGYARIRTNHIALGLLAI